MYNFQSNLFLLTKKCQLHFKNTGENEKTYLS